MEAEQMTVQWLAQEPPAIVVPVPTVVVEPQVTIPPELLERLVPPDPGLLTQPFATLIAGAMAIGAATLALWGVKRQIKAAQDNVEWQLTADAHNEKRDKKQLALNDALATLMDARHALVTLRNTGGDVAPTGQLFAMVLASAQSWALASVQLTAFGLSDAARLFDAALEPYESALNTTPTDDGFNGKFELYKKAADAASQQIRADAVEIANQPLPRKPTLLVEWELNLPFRLKMQRLGPLSNARTTDESAGSESSSSGQ